MNFTVVRANIANIAADAIVLPANEYLKEGSGASTAIFKTAGRSELTKACAEIGHCDTGSAVPTPAFDLDAKYIIHAVVPKWIDGKHNEYGLLSSAYLTSLNLADVMVCKSIAFPLLASGNNGFDHALAFQIAEKSINKFEGENIKDVILVVYDENTEHFIRSKGYNVQKISEEKSAHEYEIPNKAKKIIFENLNAAENWLKNKENVKKLIDIEIALAVLPEGGKAAKVINIAKKQINKFIVKYLPRKL